GFDGVEFQRADESANGWLRASQLCQLFALGGALVREDRGMTEFAPKPTDSVPRQWVFETVQRIWGFRLYPFQLDILCKLLNGGIYSIQMSTDHGKSMLIEMAVVVGLIIDPNRRMIV